MKVMDFVPPVSSAPLWMWNAMLRGGPRFGIFSGKGSTRRPFGFFVLGLNIGWRNTPSWRNAS